MLAAVNPWAVQTIHTPSRPSPLSERSANVQLIMTSRGRQDAPFSNRPVKANPLLRTPSAANERRRELFFKKLRRDRDDQKWESRVEEVQRLEFLSSKRRWEAEKARQASMLDDGDLVETYASESLSTPLDSRAPQDENNLEEADAILRQEEQELEALINSMKQDDSNFDTAAQPEEEDYNELFRNFPMTSGTKGSQAQPGGFDMEVMDMEAMDTSEG